MTDHTTYFRDVINAVTTSVDELARECNDIEAQISHYRCIERGDPNMKAAANAGRKADELERSTRRALVRSRLFKHPAFPAYVERVNKERLARRELSAEQIERMDGAIAEFRAAFKGLGLSEPIIFHSLLDEVAKLERQLSFTPCDAGKHVLPTFTTLEKSLPAKMESAA